MQRNAETRLPGTSVTILAFVLSALATGFLLFWTAYPGVDPASGGGLPAIRSASVHGSGLLQPGGWSALGPLSVPVALTLIPLLLPQSRSARVLVAVLMCGFVAASGFSIGILYLPAVVASVIAALPAGWKWHGARFDTVHE